MHPSSWCVRYCCFSAQAPRGSLKQVHQVHQVHQAPPAPSFRIGSFGPQREQRWPRPISSGSPGTIPWFLFKCFRKPWWIHWKKHTTWNSWGPWPAGCFFLNWMGWIGFKQFFSWSDGISRTLWKTRWGIILHTGKPPKPWLTTDCKIIKEPWATPDRATPTSCYSFKKKRKKQKN